MRLKWLVFLWLVSFANAAVASDLSRLGIIEVELTSDRDYENPFWDVDVAVEVKSPSGETSDVEAFWDGGRTWRARWRGDESGSWSWRATSTDETNAGLNAAGEIEHGEARPPHRLRVSDDGTHFVQSGGAPFFWLADTAWNGALRSREEDWRAYLENRAKQRFTAIQFVTTQWRGGNRMIPRHAFSGTKQITIDPAAFTALDEKIVDVVKQGLRPAPVMLWALTESDPGRALDESDAIRLARYQVARWSAFAPVWFLGGDGRYEGKATARWKRIGEGVFGDKDEEIVTLHPSGLSWVGDEFGKEGWFDFIGYQSGHGDGANDLRWLTQGPPSEGASLGKPVINLEPNYEGHPAYQSGRLHDAKAVRRAAYWSMLVHPPAGVSYGNNEIWVWNEQTADAEAHGNLRGIRPWHEGVETEGISDMTHLRDFFESGPWTRLRPAQGMLADQPGKEDPSQFIAVARASMEGGEPWIVAYLPEGGEVVLEGQAFPDGSTIEWFNPRSGKRSRAEAREGDLNVLRAPDGEDWILSIR